MPDGIKKTLTGVLSELAGLFDLLDESRVDALVDAVAGAGTLFVAGAGRSGLLLRCFAMRVMHMGKKVHVTGDVTTPSAQPGDMLLIGSGSGETGSLAAMARKAKDIGMKVALVTTNPASTIAKLSDIVVVIPGPTPKNVGVVKTAVSAQPMGSLFEQGMFLVLDASVQHLMAKLDLTSDEMFKRHANLE